MTADDQGRREGATWEHRHTQTHTRPSRIPGVLAWSPLPLPGRPRCHAAQGTGVPARRPAASGRQAALEWRGGGGGGGSGDAQRRGDRKPLRGRRLGALDEGGRRVLLQLGRRPLALADPQVVCYWRLGSFPCNSRRGYSFLPAAFSSVELYCFPYALAGWRCFTASSGSGQFGS